MKALKVHLILFISVFLIFSCSKDEPVSLEKNVTLPAPDPNLTSVSSFTNHIIADSTNIAEENSTCTIEVNPVNVYGENLGGKLDKIVFTTNVGEFTGEVQYNSTSKTYYQTLSAIEGETGYATISCKANWINIVDTAYVKFYLGVYIPDDNFLELLQASVDVDEELKTYEIYEEDLSEVTSISGGSDIVLISGIEYCTSLEELEITNNSISDLSPLSDITTLISINMTGNKITDLSALENLENLETLILERNSIVNIEPVVNLTKLVELNLRKNQIVNVPSLENLVNLEKLDLSNNNIENPNLSGLENLTELNLSNNELANIESLSELTNLTSLNLESDNLIDISSLENLVNLTTLNLKNNSISDISILQKLNSLETLDLSENNIVGIEPLVNNDGIGDGDVIDLRGNPLSEEAINTHIPALEDRGVTVYYDTES